VFIDFGVWIIFSPTMAIGSRASPIPPVRGYACAEIHYPEGAVGKLLYLRPCDLPDVQIDVRAYRNANSDFPHESTLDQWFSESRFESYRGLGDAEMTALGPLQDDKGQPHLPLPDLFTVVHEHLVGEAGIEFDLATEGNLAVD
jgi:hypothetical protein